MSHFPRSLVFGLTLFALAGCVSLPDYQLAGAGGSGGDSSGSTAGGGGKASSGSTSSAGGGASNGSTSSAGGTANGGSTSGAGGTAGSSSASGTGGNSSECSNNEAKCQDDSVWVCTDGRWAEAAKCEGSTPICLWYEGDAKCVACTPGEQDCLDAETRQVCNEQGWWKQDTKCTGSTPVCSKGSCVSPSCSKGSDCSYASDDCHVPTCESGRCSEEPAPRGTSCASGYCDDLGVCVECLDDTQCGVAQGLCMASYCDMSSYTCMEAVQDPGASCAGASCNASQTCTCDDGHGDCDLDTTNGCETNLNGDLRNCGDCGTVCSTNYMDFVECNGGRCDGPCLANWNDCNSDKAKDGCETLTIGLKLVDGAGYPSGFNLPNGVPSALAGDTKSKHIEAWIRPGAGAPQHFTAPVRTVVSLGLVVDAIDSGPNAGQVAAGRRLRLQLSDTGGLELNVGGGKVLSAGFTPTAGRMTFVFAGYSPAKGYYVGAISHDGVLHQATQAVDADFPASTLLDLDEASIGRGFTGEIDRVRLWSAVPSEIDLAAWRNTRLTPDSHPNLVQQWWFNETVGTTQPREDVSGETVDVSGRASLADIGCD